MTVQTPSYWKDERYQPLIEVKTINGNTVRIPKLFEYHWEMHSNQREYLVEMWQNACKEGALQETTYSRGKWAVDLIKTFLEVYKE